MNILVLGEFCLDKFIYGSTRSAPDGPFFVFKEESQTENWGCAGNVVKNLESLAPDFNIEFIHNDQPITKTRFVDKKSNYTLLRKDENDEVLPLGERQVTELINRDDFAKFSSVVISDYNKGFLTKQDIYRISKRCYDLNIPVWTDTKKILGEWSKLITFIKINNVEWQDNLKNNVNPSEFCQHLIVTCGGKGICYRGEIFPVEPVVIQDLSGCGDLVLVALISKYLKSKDIKESIHYANKVARVGASKKGVVVIKPEEIV